MQNFRFIGAMVSEFRFFKKKKKKDKQMVCHNSFDVELLYITKKPNRRCLSTKTPEVATKTPVVTTKTPLGNN